MPAARCCTPIGLVAFIPTQKLPAPIIKIEELARTVTLFGRTRTEPGAGSGAYPITPPLCRPLQRGDDPMVAWRGWGENAENPRENSRQFPLSDLLLYDDHTNAPPARAGRRDIDWLNRRCGETK